MPWIRAMVRAVGTKGSVQRTAVGMPSFSKVMPSCKLHEEQEPQSPLDVISTSQLSAISLTMFSGQGVEALGFAFLITFEKL